MLCGFWKMPTFACGSSNCLFSTKFFIMTSLINDVDNVYIYGGSFNINQQYHGE